MALRRVRSLGRSFVVAAFATTVAVTSLAGTSLAADQRFDITGTVVDVKGDLIVVLTSDVVCKPQPITVDISQLRGLQVVPDSPIQLTIMSREDDSYLATGIVRESPYVDGADFGVQESMTTRQDSIQAGVGNVPDDDEALNQQHRNGNLRRNDKNDDENGNGNRAKDK